MSNVDRQQVRKNLQNQYIFLIQETEKKKYRQEMDEIIIDQQQQVKQKPQTSKKIQLLLFEEEDENQIQMPQFEDEQLPQVSIISENEKHKREVRTKVKQYIQDYRKSLGQNYQNKLHYRDDDEEIDGALLGELDQIKVQAKSKSQIEAFVLAFSKNPQNAIAQYVKKQIIQNDSPESIAAYLIKAQGIDKEMLGQYFGKNNPRNLKILHSFCNQLKFQNIEFDKAIRQLLALFKLPGQSQQIQRIVWEFSLAYQQANSKKHENADELFPLSYAIIMLATDAHNPKQEKKMTREQFVKNTQGPCPSISPEYLSGIYDRITKEKFKTELSYLQISPVISINDIQAFKKLTNYLKKGQVFLKVCWGTKKYVQRKLYLSEDQSRIEWVCDPKKKQDQIPRFINIADITDLTLGLGSEVMRKNNVPLQFENLCFTITTPHRTLDIKAKTIKERGKWINYIRMMLIKRREEKAKQLELNYKTNISFQQIEQIWNNQIFPRWDDHWDYKKKKPKQKNVIVRGFEAICGCFSKQQKNQRHQFDNANTGKRLTIKSSVLDTLWGLGLPANSRKILWPIVIGNNLAITPMIIEQIKKRAKNDTQISKFNSFHPEVIELAQICREFRPDIPPVRQILIVSQIFWKVFPKNQSISPLLNQLHQDHFLSFYRADKNQIDSRIKLFEYLLQTNAPKVLQHFKGLKLQIRMFLVSWFLSIFYDCFSDNEELVLRIWDNFLLQGQIYLFKVGIAIIKYYQIQLNMCSFHEGFQLLRFPKNTSTVLFFKILEEKISVKDLDYYQYVQKRKNAVIKTRVQAIPLQ